jgi:hypothetical protein
MRRIFFRRRLARLAARIAPDLESRARRVFRLPSTIIPRNFRKDGPGFIYIYLAIHAGVWAAKIGSSNDWERRREEHARKCVGQVQEWALVYKTRLRYRTGEFLSVSSRFFVNHASQNGLSTTT